MAGSDRGEYKYGKRNLSYFNFVYHKPDMDCPMIETGQTGFTLAILKCVISLFPGLFCSW
jgi:hypothetical protein